jgi:hypothetical protein
MVTTEAMVKVVLPLPAGTAWLIPVRDATVIHGAGQLVGSELVTLPGVIVLMVNGCPAIWFTVRDSPTVAPG